MLKTEMTGAPTVLVGSVGDEMSADSRLMNGGDRKISRIVLIDTTSHVQKTESRG